MCPGVERYMQFFESEWIDHQGLTLKKWLRSSPELQLKRVLAESEVPGVFEIATCFRNKGELSPWHNPEFSMVEWYERSGALDDLIERSEQLIRYCIEEFLAREFLARSQEFLARSQEILARSQTLTALPTLTPRFSVAELFRDVLKVDLYSDDPMLADKLIAAGCHSVRTSDDFDTAFFKAMLDHIEPHLRQFPLCFVYDYPSSTSALATVESGWARRFEAYMHGVELCNGFQEMINAEVIKEQISSINQLRKHDGHSEITVDPAILTSIAKLKKPYIGNAMGFERLGALILNHQSIDAWLIRH
jgi:lysyl-tRNA synthetase class 2